MSDPFTKRTAPLTSAFVLALRAEFDDVKIIAVRENSVEIGEFSEREE